MHNRGIIIQAGPYTFNSRLCGGHRIAHYLRSNHDWDIEVVDFGWIWTEEQLKKFIDSRSGPDLKWIGIGMMFVNWIEKWTTLFEYIKKKNPDIMTVFGSGAAPNFVCQHIDYYVYGFGEHAIVSLLKYQFSNGPRPRFSLADRHNRKLIDSNNQHPAYPMKSLDIRYEDRDFLTPVDSLTVEFSRGCKFTCAFCNFPVLGVKGDYSRDADDFRSQLVDAYDRFGVTRYHVADETFNDRTEKITKFADVVEKLDFVPWFSAYIRADLLIARPRDREELLRMNLTGHYYGIETFNRESGKIIGKGYDTEKLKQGLLDVKQYFLQHGLYRGVISLINGLPGENIESMKSSIQWLKDHWIGQSAQIFALDLAEGDLVKKSKMAADYQKYGYKKIDTAKKSKIDVKYARDVYTEYIDWENDLTSRDECMKLGDEFAKEFVHDPRWKIGNWSINSYGYLPLEEAFDKPVSDIRGDSEAHHQKPEVKKIIQTYINNKIDWTKH